MVEHSCRACILYCMDFRLHDTLQELMKQEGLDEDRADVIRVAGAAKNLARPEDPRDRERLFEMFKTSYDLHHARQFYLVNHEDCGAYGLEVVADDDSEVDMHHEDLKRAGIALAERFPDVEVRRFFVWLDGQIDPVAPRSER
jgi:hypothetical protein